MQPANWHYPPDWPANDQDVLVLYNTGFATRVRFKDEPAKAAIAAWQPWVDPPAPPVSDPFEEWWRDKHGGAHYNERDKQTAIRAWNAALAHGVSTLAPAYRWKTYDEWRKFVQLPSYTDWANDAWIAARELANPPSKLLAPTPSQSACKHEKWKSSRPQPRHCQECGLKMWDAGD